MGGPQIDDKLRDAIHAATLFLIAGVIACFRIAGHKSILYQGIAHIFVGGLFGAWFVLRHRDYERSGIYRVLAWGLTFVELACFTYSKFVR
jgi:hypothetical protein